MRGTGFLVLAAVMVFVVLGLMAGTAVTGNVAVIEQARASQAASMASAWQMTLPLMCLSAMMPFALIGAAAVGALVWAWRRGGIPQLRAGRPTRHPDGHLRPAVPQPPDQMDRPAGPALPAPPMLVVRRPAPPAITQLQPRGWGWDDDDTSRH